MVDSKEFDVIIIGCGFAGLYLTKLLSQKYKVCIIEKNDQVVGPLNTTGSTMYNGLDDIFTLFNLPKSLIVNNYNSLEIQGTKNKFISLADSFSWALLDIPKLKEEVSRGFDESTTVLLGHEIINVIKGNGRYVGVEARDVKNSNLKNILGKIIVDATGSRISLVKQIGLETPKHLSKCFQVDADVTEPIDYSQIKMYLGFNFCPAGYAYIFPISKNRIRIGTCGIPDLSRREFLAEDLFNKFIAYTELNLENISNKVNLEVFTGGMTKKNSHLNFIAIGDAAGYISPVIGEGIRFAFHSADIASKLIEESLIKNDMRILENFNYLWKKRFGLKFSVGYFMQLVFARASNERIDKFVGKLNSISLKDPGYVFRIFATKFRIYDIIKIII